MDKEWIGIQFNLLDDGVVKGRESLKAMGIEITSDHVTIKFTRKELKKFNPKTDSEKLRIALSLLKKYLAKSDYTNIYTSLDADRLSSSKTLLQQTDFKEDRLRLKDITDKTSFINNYKVTLTHQSVINLIKKNPLMKFMDTILLNIVDRDFALEQKLTLELAYEDKEEWGADRDNLNISIQLEIVDSSSS